MMINDVTSRAGAHPRRKRVGRGESSGMGRTSGRGNKGAQSRAGYSRRLTSEGGQMPIFRRLPKRGFNNFNFRTEYAVVNLADLEARFEPGATVDRAALAAAGLLRGRDVPVKILGDGELTRKLTVTADAASAKARAAIEQAGGTLTIVPRRDPAALARAKRNTRKKSRKAPAAG